MKPILLCLLIAVLPGCKRRPPPPAPASTLPAAPANPETDLADLTIAVRSYIMTQGKPPETLDDLVKANCIPRLPKPPPGKKYVLDAKKAGVRLADQ